MTDTTDDHDVGRPFAHASFKASPDLAAEHEVWREVSDELARRFDVAQLLQPGPALASELRALVDGKVTAFRRTAAMNGKRGMVDPEGVAQRVLDRLIGLGFLAPLLALPNVEEVTVNGSRVFVMTRGWQRRRHWRWPRGRNGRRSGVCGSRKRGCCERRSRCGGRRAQRRRGCNHCR
jgi:hypothetical protein